ncbi:MAG TPA: serine hydrolase [Terriglobales bacterium]|nr:serine hydrolase [Terriglobales bacterium]
MGERSSEAQWRERLAPAWQVLRDAIAARAFPGAAAAVLHEPDTLVVHSEGNFTYERDSPRVMAETLYDLASLTKVIATTSMAMLLHDRGQLDVEAPIGDLVPEFLAGSRDDRRRRVTVRQLLEHSSGLPAYVKLYQRAHGKQEISAAACDVPLAAEPGTRAEYSDIGFIILGAALERIAGASLDAFTRSEIFDRLGMDATLFLLPAELCERIPPTQADEHYRKRVIQGEVHDENASAMGGVAPHAGLFAPAADVARFAAAMLRAQAPFRRESIARFTRRAAEPAGTSRALGWDTPSPPSQSGRHFGPRSYGHLGFTGTSLWIDPGRGLAVVLLTNRTWPDASSQLIRQVRPQFHDAVVECVR